MLCHWPLEDTQHSELISRFACGDRMWEEHVGGRHVRAACCLRMLAGACASGGGRGMWGGHVRVGCGSVVFAFGVGVGLAWKTRGWQPAGF